MEPLGGDGERFADRKTAVRATINREFNSAKFGVENATWKEVRYERKVAVETGGE